eukprot:1158158-Pelagomonas_calceolata.AAC.5
MSYKSSLCRPMTQTTLAGKAPQAKGDYDALWCRAHVMQGVTQLQAQPVWGLHMNLRCAQVTAGRSTASVGPAPKIAMCSSHCSKLSQCGACIGTCAALKSLQEVQPVWGLHPKLRCDQVTAASSASVGPA